MVMKTKAETWAYRFPIAKVNGKRKSLYKAGFKTKKECLAAENEAYYNYHHRNVNFTTSKMSFSDFLDYYFKEYLSREVDYGTYKLYTHYLNQEVKPALGHFKLNELPKVAIVEFLQNVANRNYSESVIRYNYTILKKSLDKAVELEYILDNKASNIKKPKPQEPAKIIRNIISKDLYEEILNKYEINNIKTAHYYVLFQIAWHCGLRIGEALGLSWDCVDLQAKTITINKQQLYRDKDPSLQNKLDFDNRYFIGNTKTNNIRTIDISDELASSLFALKKQQIATREEHGQYYEIALYGLNNNNIKLTTVAEKNNYKNLKEIEFVIRPINCGLTRRSTVDNLIKKRSKAMGVKFDYHSFRHTHATMLVERDIDTIDLMERLGHTKVETTLSSYVHNTPKIKDKTKVLLNTIF